MLDVSIRTSILNLLIKIAENESLAMVYISHDLSTIGHVCSRTAIMYLGKIVETDPTEDLINHPFHPYVDALLSSVPVPDPTYHRERVKFSGEIVAPIDLPKGCRFEPRCSKVSKICQEAMPILRNIGNGHYVA